MALTDYTSYAEVRAILGVNDLEVADTLLALPFYSEIINAELTDINDTLPSLYAAAVIEPTPTVFQSKLVSYTRLFSTYATAKTLTTSLPLFSPRAIEDGKARLERFNNPYKEVIDAVGREYDRWRLRLIDLLADLEGTVESTAVFGFTTVPLEIDPITGAIRV
jgi:hypothetical protein